MTLLIHHLKMMDAIVPKSQRHMFDYNLNITKSSEFVLDQIKLANNIGHYILTTLPSKQV